MGSITKITGERKELYYFNCSKEFCEKLSQLQELDDLRQLSSIEGLKCIEQEKKETKAKTKKETVHNKVRTYKYLARVGLFTLFLFVISLFASSYISSHFMNQTTFTASTGDILTDTDDISSDNDNTSFDIKWSEDGVDFENDYGEGLGNIGEGEAGLTNIESNEEIEEEETGNDPADDMNTDMSNPDLAYFEVEKMSKSCLPEGYVALTIDDGPSEYTKKIVDILIENQVGATFFFIGVHALSYPESVQYASSKGMSIGNHTWSHKNLTTLSTDEQIKEIEKTDAYLTSLTDKPVTLFRPPYGRADEKLMETLDNKQLRSLGWNRDPRDWQVSTTREIENYFSQTDPCGAIYLLHENKFTLEALPDFINKLKEENLEIVVLQ